MPQDLVDYSIRLNDLTRTEKFLSLSNDEQQKIIDDYRQASISENPGVDVDSLNKITESENVNFLRNTGKGRILPNLQEYDLPTNSQEWQTLSEDQKLSKLEEFRNKIPDLAATKPTQKGDIQFGLTQAADEIERRIKGADTGYIHDKASRFGEGAVAGFLNYTGFDEAARETRRWFEENPEYDDSLVSGVASGLGDAASSMAVWAASVALTEGLGATATTATTVATLTSLVSNGMVRYRDAYEKAIAEGLDDSKANDAGVASMPSALIDVLGDKIIAGRVMPHGAEKAFRIGTDMEKRAILSSAFKDASTRNKVMEIARDALGEGLTEAGGDYVAGYGAYLATDDESFIPKSKELANSFVIGSLIGGGIASATEAPKYIGSTQGSVEIEGEEQQYQNKDQFRIGETIKKLDKIPNNKEIFSLLKNGQYKQAMELSTARLSEIEQAQAEEESLRLQEEEKLKESNKPEVVIDESSPEESQITKISDGHYEYVTDFGKGVIQVDPANDAEAFEQAKILAKPIPQDVQSENNIIPETRFSTEQGEYSIQEGGSIVSPLETNPESVVFISPEVLQRVSSLSEAESIVKEGDNLVIRKDGEDDESIAVSTKPSVGNFPVEIFNNGKEVKVLPSSITGVNQFSVNPKAPSIDFTTPSKTAATLKGFGFEVNGNSANVRAITNWNKKGGIEEIRKQAQDRVNGFSSIEGEESKAKAAEWQKVLDSLPKQTVSEINVIPETLNPKKSKTLQAAELKKKAAEAPVKSKATKIVPALYLHKFEPFEGVQSIDAFEDHLKGRFGPGVDLALNQMFIDLRKYNPKITFEFANDIAAAGGYLPNNNKIVFAPRGPNLLTAFHEVAHALTYSEITKLGLTKPRDIVSSVEEGAIQETNLRQKSKGIYSDSLKNKDVPFYVKDLIDVYLHSANELGIDINENIDEQSFADKHGIDNYGFYDLAEFVSEAFSNSVFQERLSDIQYEGRSAWQKIVDSIRTFLEWMNIVAPADLVMRNDGNNALRETLVSIRELIGTSATIEESNKLAAQKIEQDINQNNINPEQEQKPLSKSEEIKRINRQKFEQSKQAALDAINDLPNEGPLRFKKANLLISLNKAETIQDCADVLESASIIYRPQQQADKELAASYKRLDSLMRGKIDDKIDRNSIELLRLVRQFKRSDISKMSEENQSIFFSITDNIYNARKKGISNPSQRFDHKTITETLVDLKKLSDASAITEMISSFDDVIDFDSLNINLDDRSAVEQAINDYMDSNGIDPNAGRSEAMRRKQEKINQGFRNEANEIKKYLADRYADASNFIEEYESVYGNISSKSLRDFVKLHYNYLLSSDLDQLEGQELYKHFFGINNLSDLVITHVEPTIRFIANQKDSDQRISEYSGMFRDPLLRGSFKGGVDRINQVAELKQVQLARASAYPEAQRFLQEDVLGDLFHSIVQEGTNRSIEIKKNLNEALDFILKKYGKDFLSTEDAITISIYGRLVQYQAGENPDAALKRNIEKERQSIKNKIDNDPRPQKSFQIRALPIFESMVSEADSMDQFVSSMESRLAGQEDNGAMRSEVIRAIQDAFSGFTAESRIISEAFHGKQFNEVVNYIPSEVTNKATKENSSEFELDDVASMVGGTQKAGLVTKIAYYNARSSSLGKTEYYSYNPRLAIDRSVDILSYDHESMLSRKVLKERLKKGSVLNQVLSGGEEENPRRVSHIRNVALSVIQNAVTRGEPAGLVTNAMRVLTKLYAVPRLSSLHHIVSQPASTFLDYGIRTGRWGEWVQSAIFYASNKTKVDEFFNKHSKWVAGRTALEAMSLDDRLSPGDDATIWDSPMAKKLNLVYDKAQHILTTSLRVGDDFSAKATILAEYFNNLKKKGYKYSSIDEIDLTTIEGNAMTQASLNAERSINASNKILRGDLHQDRNINLSALRNCLFAFSAHSNSLATQLNLAVRDAYDLVLAKAPKSDIKSKIRTIAAIVVQSVSFTTIRYGMLGILGMGMANLVKDLFDDEEGKIAKLQKELYIAQKKGDQVRIAQAENDLALAKSVRKQIAKFEANNLSSDSWFKQVARDSFGQIFYPMNTNAAQTVLYWPADFVAESIYKDVHQSEIASLKNNIKDAKKEKDFDAAARLEEKLANIQGIEYIPFAYQNIGGVDLGGVYGGAVENVFRQLQKAIKQGVGTEEFNVNDLYVYAATSGIGQSDMTKLFNIIDKIEQEQFERKAKDQSNLEDARKRKKEAVEKENDRLLRSLMR